MGCDGFCGLAPPSNKVADVFHCAIAQQQLGSENGSRVFFCVCLGITHNFVQLFARKEAQFGIKNMLSPHIVTRRSRAPRSLLIP